MTTGPQMHFLKHFCEETLQKMKFSIKDFFTNCDQIRRKLRFGHIYWRNP